MKKIDYEVVEFNVDGVVKVRITNQTNLGYTFGNVHRAAGGKIDGYGSEKNNAFLTQVYGKRVVLASCSYPANEYMETDTFWTWGDYGSRAGTIVQMTHAEFVLFAGAVQKYNETFADFKKDVEKAGILSRKRWMMTADGKYIDSYSNPQTRETVTDWCKDRIRDTDIKEIRAYPYDENADVIIVRNTVVERVVKEKTVTVAQ